VPPVDGAAVSALRGPGEPAVSAPRTPDDGPNNDLGEPDAAASEDSLGSAAPLGWGGLANVFLADASAG
jgi:hypothetical protein